MWMSVENVAGLRWILPEPRGGESKRNFVPAVLGRLFPPIDYYRQRLSKL
jgi:hypothetical protein